VGEKVRPPSVDFDCTTRIPLVPFPVQMTTISETPAVPAAIATRGGCSPFTRASPGVEFTWTGAENVRPASRLVAANTSVCPLGKVADQAATTSDRSVARETFAFARPGTASAVGLVAALFDAPAASTRTAPTAIARNL
jgi:hypothetical protein